MESGFHGDKYLQKVADVLLERCDYFIETGTNVGSTLAYVARNHPDVACLSCEPHKDSYDEAKKNTSQYHNVTIFNKTSQEFIKTIQNMNLTDEKVLFWLDAHGYGFKWPLKEEIEYITHNFKKAYILIDDFMVPGRDMFKWDEYQDQECSFEYIKGVINSECKISLFYPSYTEKTSTFHPLTGWGLIVYGYDDMIFPEELKDKILQQI